MVELFRAKPSSAAMMIFIDAVFQVCVNCGVLYGPNTMSTLPQFEILIFGTD